MDDISEVKYKDRISTSKMCHFAMYSVKLVESIKKQGIHSRKTFTISKPNIKPELMNHFIRGYFDGDGSFIFIENRFIIWITYIHKFFNITINLI